MAPTGPSGVRESTGLTGLSGVTPVADDSDELMVGRARWGRDDTAI